MSLYDDPIASRWMFESVGLRQDRVFPEDRQESMTDPTRPEAPLDPYWTCACGALNLEAAPVWSVRVVRTDDDVYHRTPNGGGCQVPVAERDAALAERDALAARVDEWRNLALGMGRYLIPGEPGSDDLIRRFEALAPESPEPTTACRHPAERVEMLAHRDYETVGAIGTDEPLSWSPICRACGADVPSARAESDERANNE